MITEYDTQFHVANKHVMRYAKIQNKKSLLYL